VRVLVAGANKDATDGCETAVLCGRTTMVLVELVSALHQCESPAAAPTSVSTPSAACPPSASGSFSHWLI
jgi:hypothetical protein